MLYTSGSVVIFTARRYATAVYAVVVCLSVRLSVTRRYCTKMAKDRIMQTMSYDSTGTLCFQMLKISAKLNGVTPIGAPNRGGVGKNRRFSTNISLYLRNSARWGNSYFGRLIGT